jgi:hypothetical protein
VVTVIVAREGNLSVGDHLAEMQEWLFHREIEPLELAPLRVIKFRVEFQATFASAGHARLFVDRSADNDRSHRNRTVGARRGE